ncbi:Glucose-6-phosphate/phosphate translocator 1, chloroplastic [Capsicum annuum]|nr:Glucose-6-phosphate/phosphate translocator 1, chloroplastic [Capsicum annuum]KAF3672478.1 Glucose-6-phosphate/phosphate translocator 1, chloroplastic [Capsicum annuum]
MISTVKQSAFTINGCDFIRSKSQSLTFSHRFSLLPPLPAAMKSRRSSGVSFTKPIYVSSVENFGGLKKERSNDNLVKVKAYEADRIDPIEGPDSKTEVARRLKIGVYFATWWFLNVIFNIYNKKVLNAFPFPWLTSTLSLAAGSLIMLMSWTLRIAETPKTDLEFWKTLLPVAVAHTIGHVAATVSMSKVAVSFTHIIKSGEPAFSVLVSRFLLGETFPTAVYLSLIPIIGGCGLSALTELNFNWIGFAGAMISNVAFVFRNIFSKRGMKGKSVSGMNYYACLSMLSLLLLTPFAIAVEGPQMWALGFEKAVSQIGPQIVWWMAAQSVFYHLYNQVSYMSLDEISPLTFSIGNTMKRISVIVSSIIIFRTPVQPINALGAAIAILGTFLQNNEEWNLHTAVGIKTLKRTLRSMSLRILSLPLL